MNYILLPSLEQAAVVRTASLLYNHCELEKRLEEDTAVSNNERWQLFETEIAEKLSPLLHSSLPKTVAEVIRPMRLEVRRWKTDHECFLKRIDSCFCAYLCWKTDGTINRIQTSKQIIADENVVLEIRFKMACTYFLEDEVIALWSRFEEMESRDIYLYGTNIAIRFWIEWLEKKDTRHWTEMIDEYFRNQHLRLRDICTRISCFYHLLSRESKKNFDLLETITVHSDDFQMCVIKMNEAERIKVFRYMSLHALILCLRWPFVSLFIRMAKAVMWYLTANEFSFLLYLMLLPYNNHKFKDFQVFETFWQISPSVFKDGAKKNELLIMKKNQYIEDVSVPDYFKEILRKCLD